MFETKILIGTEFSEPNSTLEGGALRAFDWPELVARIAATNDLRRVVKSSASGFGAFAALAAEIASPETMASEISLDESVSDEPLNKGKHAVNPNALEAGKTPSPKAVVDDKHATLGDRKQA